MIVLRADRRRDTCAQPRVRFPHAPRHQRPPPTDRLADQSASCTQRAVGDVDRTLDLVALAERRDVTGRVGLCIGWQDGDHRVAGSGKRARRRVRKRPGNRQSAASGSTPRYAFVAECGRCRARARQVAELLAVGHFRQVDLLV